MEIDAINKEIIYESHNSIVYKTKKSTDVGEKIFKVSKQKDLSGLYNEFQILEDNKFQFGNSKIIFDDSKTTLVRDYVPGKSLKQIFAEGKFGLSFFMEFAPKISENLFDVHLKNIIHKDLSPGNIIIDEETKKVTLIDYELSTKLRLSESVNQLSFDLIGNLHYISPEQTGRMNRLIDYRSDYYSLGICFFEMLTGTTPFSSDDPLEIVYAHLAHTPPSLNKHNKEIPPIINTIIQKLLSKNAEERYHSLQGLLYDLNKCFVSWNISKSIPEFLIGTSDIPARLHVSQVMVGRDAELKSLFDCFEKAAQGKKVILKVSGYSGIGKTMLIQEAAKPMTQKSGIFLSGKYDRLQRNTPYSAFSQALELLADLILSESEETVALWKSKIIDSLGVLSRIVIDLNVKWEKILGPLEALPSLSGKEWQNRLHFVLGNLIKLIASPQHPLILFIDDCQWADDASFDFLNKLIANKDINHCLIVLTYRHNELNTSPLLNHFFNAMADAEKQEDLVSAHIHIEQIMEHDCKKLIEHTLQNTTQDFTEFTSLIYQKTEGNPFFINQLLDYLYEKKSLYLNVQTKQWEWDEEVLRELNVVDDAAGILLDKINLLPTETTEALTFASLFGTKFTLQELSSVLNKKDKDLHAILWPAVVQHLIIPQKVNYKYVPDFYDEKGIDIPFKFAHDKLQQALYSQVKEEERQALHYKIGKRLLEQGNTIKIYKTANHFIIAKDETIKQGANPQIEKCLLLAGKRSFNAASFESAFRYLDLYISLTDNTTILTADYCLYLEAALITDALPSLDEQMSLALNGAKTLIDRATIYENMIRAYCADDKFQKAIDLSRKALLEFGIKLPHNASKGLVIIEAIKTQFSLPAKKLNQIHNFPQMKEERAIGATRIMKEAALAFFFGELATYPVVIFKMVQLSAKYGNIPESMVAYSSYCIILAGVMKNPSGAYLLGKETIQIMNEYKNQRYYTTTGFVDGAFVSHWKEPLTLLALNHKKYYQQGLEVGNTEYALFNSYWALFYDFLLGKPLSILIADQEKLLKEVHLYNLKSQLPRIESMLAMFKIFNTKSDGQYVLLENENEVLESLLKNKNGGDYLGVMVQKATLALWFGEYGKATEFIEKTFPLKDAVMSTYWLPYIDMIQCIAAFNTYAKDSDSKQKLTRKLYSAISKKLETTTKLYDGNVKWIADFLNAEYNALVLSKFNSSQYFEAIEQSNKNQFVLPALLIQMHLMNQLKGLNQAEYLELESKVKTGLVHLGMTAVYENKFGQNIELTQRQTLAQTTAAHTSNYSLDYLTILKSTQALTSEILLDKLLHKLLSFAMENAGAKYGAFLMKMDRSFETKIEMTSKVSANQIVYNANTDGSFKTLPTTIINYVKQSGSSLVLDEAVNNPPYSSDPLIIENKEQSILCLPVIHKSECIGIIYLSNSITKAAFSAERIELIKMISGQIGVSIENALLYSNLENLVQERTLQLKNEKEKSDKLLLNILPSEIAQELKVNGFAKPRKYKQVTVLFCDIKGFSMRAENMTAEKLVQELDYCFKNLDEIISKFGLEKIKTIGDAYMCAGGVPVPSDDNYLKVLQAAIEIKKWIREETEKAKLTNTEFPQLRIGIHTGSLVAGIVGTSKFAYDIWGDTVNIAARMEQYGEAGEINISEQTYNLINSKYNCEYRGEIQVKNKGNLKMYFVKNELAEVKQ
jgi:predicted ATPase/class 3 adenylate cyclase/predicted Ser/Thr protein kinase